MIDPRYINADGFVTVNPNANPIPGDGNGILQTGLAIALGLLPDDHVVEMLLGCRKSISCPLIFRSPHKRNPDDEQTQDDYWGALPLNKSWAEEILEYGQKHLWIMDVHEEGRLTFWFGRYLPFAPFTKICAGVKLNCVERKILKATIYLDALKTGSASGNMIAYCRAWACVQRDPFFADAFAYWLRKVRKRYGTLGASWAAYFGPGHPLNEVR